MWVTTSLSSLTRLEPKSLVSLKETVLSTVLKVSIQMQSRCITPLAKTFVLSQELNFLRPCTWTRFGSKNVMSLLLAQLMVLSMLITLVN